MKIETRIKRIKEENSGEYNIKVTGTKENKNNAWDILVNAGTSFGSTLDKRYYSKISKRVLILLDKAKIKYKILK